MTIRLITLCVACLAWLQLCPGNAAEPVFRIQRVGGADEFSPTAEWNAEGLRLSGEGRFIPMHDLISVRLVAPPVAAAAPTSLVYFAHGDRLVGELASADGEQLFVHWAAQSTPGLIAIPLEQIETAIFQLPPSGSQRLRLYRSLALDPRKQDVARLNAGDRVTGEFQSLDARELRLSGPDGELRVSREKLVALQFDPQLVTAAKLEGTYFLLSFRDGTRLFAKRVETSPDSVHFVTMFGAELSVPRAELTACQVFHDRVQSLSFRSPAEFLETPYLSQSWGWTKDRNVLFGPLRVGKQEFGLGLGMHSRSELTYELQSQDREFRAVVGVDQAAEGGGSVNFQVLLDGQVAWSSPLMTGDSEPLTVPPIPIDGKRRLTLRVDYGEFGDVSDYADWCDPIIIRNP